VQPPTGYEQEGRVCKLNKPLDGSKQAPRIWYNSLSSYLEELGIRHLQEGSGLFVHKDGTIIAVYVDEVEIIGPSSRSICARLGTWPVLIRVVAT
jgi:hypothetical protein